MNTTTTDEPNRTELTHDDGRDMPAEQHNTDDTDEPRGIVCDETVIGEDGATVDTLKE